MPPAYRFFQFIITASGAKYLRQAARGETFNEQGFMRKNERKRVDKYQALMEAEEIVDATKMVEQSAQRMRGVSDAHEELLVRKTDEAIGELSEGSRGVGGKRSEDLQVLHTRVKEAEANLREAKAVPMPLKPPSIAQTAREFAKRPKTKTTSTTAAEAERVNAQADAVKAMTELHKQRARKKAWETKQHDR